MGFETQRAVRVIRRSPRNSRSGALLVVSHDLPFLRDLELTRWVRLEQDELVDIDPL